MTTNRLSEFLSHQAKVKMSGDHKARFCCPCHDDHSPSAEATLTDGGNILAYCQVCRASGLDMARKLGLPASILSGSLPSDNRVGKVNGKFKTSKVRKPKTIHPTLERAIAAAKWCCEQNAGKPLELSGLFRLIGGRMFTLRFEPPGGRPKECSAVSVVGSGWIVGDLPGLLPLYIAGGIDILPEGDALWVFEGEAKADTGNRIGLPSVSSTHGAKSAQRHDWSLAQNRHVIIAIDNDDPGRKFGDKVKSLVFASGALSVKTVCLTPNIDGGDIIDLAKQLDDDAKLREAVLFRADAVSAATQPRIDDPFAQFPLDESGDGDADQSGNEKPQIVAKDRQLPEITNDVIRAMSSANDPPVIFNRGGSPVRLRADDKGRTTIAIHNETSLRGHLARVADFYMPAGKHMVGISPPMEMVRDILSVDLNDHAKRANVPDFSTLEAVTAMPVIRPDGTILESVGYDAATRLYYAPPVDFKMPPVSENPAPDEMRMALSLVNEAIGDFPYEADADHANAAGTLLTPAIRQAIDGKSPLAVIDAPQAGTGKSLFAEAVGTIFTGEFPAMMGAPSDDEEWRKQITATLGSGPTIVVIDNVDRTLSSSSLSRALTASVWSDRMLGFSQQVNLIQRATWMSTGNNVQLGGDLPRRCYRIRLDAKTARPWRGRSFRHPDLLHWIAENRGQLVWAMLTVCRAWYAAGRPKAPSPIIGGFECWSKTIGGILNFCGISGFLANLDEMYNQADNASAEWDAFLEAWHRRFGSEGISTSVLVEELQADGGKELRESLPEALGGFVVFQPGAYMQPARFVVKDVGKFRIRLGKQLKQRLGRRHGDDGRYLAKIDDRHTKSSVWRVESAGSAGSCGSVSNPIASRNGLEHASSHTLSVGVMAGNTPATIRTSRNCDATGDDSERQQREAIQAELGRRL